MSAFLHIYVYSVTSRQNVQSFFLVQSEFMRVIHTCFGRESTHSIFDTPFFKIEHGSRPESFAVLRSVGGS